MRTIDVYLECDVIEARVLVGLQSDLSLFEHAVLRAIGAGVTSIAQLVNHLEVSHRVLVDTLGDLWLAEHVVLDATGDEERLSLSSRAHALLETDAISELGCVYQTQETRPLLFDTLIGRLLPMRAAIRLTSRELRALRVPRSATDPQCKDLEPSELIRGIDEDLRRRDSGFIHEAAAVGQAGLRVIDAYIPPDQAPGRPRFVPLRVQITTDDVLGLQVHVSDRQLSERERQLATNRLQRLVDERPNIQFVKALAGQAPTAPLEEPPPLPAAVADLRDKITALARSGPGTRQSQHERMRAELALLGARIAGTVAQEVDGEILDGPEDHERAMRSLIRGARTQLVLTGPWVSFAGLDKYIPDLERAIERGVQLILIWGIGAQDTLDSTVVNTIENLQRRTDLHRVLVKTRTPARVHAKFAICDNRAAIVTSFNFLSSEGRREIGVRIEARVGRRCEAIEDLLAWSAEMFPDFDLAQAVVRSPESFGDYTEWPAAADISAPRYTALLDTAAAETPACTAWALSWGSAARKAEILVSQLGLAARTVRDGEHQTLMRAALVSCQRRLVITSDQLSGAVLDSEWLSMLDACLSRGVDVLLVYQRLRSDAADALTGLEELVSKHCVSPGRLVIRQDPANHAKVLVWDDHSVVGSFNFLSFPGHYSGRGRLKERGELSTHLVGCSFADHLLERFDFYGGSHSPAAPVTEPLAPSAEDLDQALKLLELFDSHEQLRAEGIASLAMQGSSPFAVLEVLAGIGAPIEVQERTCAAVLSRCDVDDAATWWIRLLGFVWTRREFVAAHAIRLAITAPGVRPHPTITAIAASFGGEGMAEVLTEVVLHDQLSAAEVTAVLLAAASELLTGGDADVADVLAILMSEAVGAIHTIGQVVERYYRTVGLPLPAAAIEAGISRQQQEVDLESSWRELEESLDRMRGYSPGYLSGKLTQATLFAKGGRFSVLGEAVTTRDAAAVTAWHSTQASVDVEHWTDRVTMESGVRPIEGGRRRPFLTRVTQVFLAAEQVARGTPSPPTESAAFQPPVVWECVDQLRTALPDAREAARAIEEPERVLAECALDSIGGLVGGN